jgi:hypothetical protein
MNLIPIKLLKNGQTKRTLLNVTGENANIDMNDFLESRIKTDKMSRQLMAIEDASELAKKYLHVKGLFERIGEDIKRETGKDFTFTCKRNTKAKKPLEYIMMEWKASGADFGHYGMARVEHDKGKAVVYDSMTNVGSSFENKFPSRYTVTTKKTLGKPQPTGGEVMDDVQSFLNKHKQLLKGFSKEDIEQIFLLSQYDELSQHHFCYVESFISMMIDLGLAAPGPKDPRERIVYVKRVAWALIHKYVPKSERNTAQWKYFVTNFPYVMTTRSGNNKFMRMRLGEFQVPPKNGYKLSVKKIPLTSTIDHTWSFGKIMKWANDFKN